jgi:uncharacterized protein (TIGR03086 family)
MNSDLLDLYARASEWTTAKVAGAASDLDAPTTCDGWDMRALLNHMLQTQKFFEGSARGEDVAPPTGAPPALIGDDPVADFENARADVLRTFGGDGVIEKTGPSLGVAFSDMLVHGWDVARSTRQDATMPAGLPEAAYDIVHGRFTDEQRKGLFKPEIPVPADAPAQDKLLAYMGRTPST